MISKKTSLAIASLVLAASGAQAALVTNEPTLTTFPVEAIRGPVASHSDPLALPQIASTPAEAEQVAWSPICYTLGLQGNPGPGSWEWAFYGCN